MRDLFELADGAIALVAAALGALSMALWGIQGVLKTRAEFFEKEVARLTADLARVEQERATSAAQKQAEIDALQRAIRGDDQLDAMVGLLTEMRSLLTRLDGGHHECPAT